MNGEISSQSDGTPLLQLHLEPDSPIEVSELTGALGALGRQYQIFAEDQGLVGRAGDARLLIASVKPGSIDINFLPDLSTVGVLIAPLINETDLLIKFAERIKALLAFFASEKKELSRISVRDCDDAVNLVSPIAQHGGIQNINVINNSNVIIPVLVTSAEEARAITEGATQHKELIQNPNADTRQGVSMTWSRVDRGTAKTAGTSSPDKGLIEEIDPKPHAVLFIDSMAYLKREMIDDEENAFQTVYFVDVSVSRVAGRIVAYRIIGYHGKEPLE
jgi:hypothetical protein